MRAAATLPALGDADPVTAATRPVVLVGGAPEPRLRIASIRAVAPLDTRAVTLISTPRDAAAHRARWLGGEVAVTLPVRLADGQVRPMELVRGRLRGPDRSRRVGRDQAAWSVMDRWQDLLDAEPTAVWWDAPGGVLFTQTTGRLEPGFAGNRSPVSYELGGVTTPVLRTGGGPWSVAEALAYLSAVGGLGLSLGALPGWIGRQPLTVPMDLAAPIGRVLARLLEAHALVVRRTAEAGSGPGAAERREVRPIEAGRRVEAPWVLAPSRAAGRVVAQETEPARERPEKWIARNAGWRVESTFVLTGGWDPALESAPFSHFVRTHSEFDRVRDVFRRWVVNEDGRFSGEPFNRGPAFDLTAFFGQGPIRPQPLPLGPSVATDRTGGAVNPFADWSLNLGANWSRYNGTFSVLTDRAGIYLEDVALSDSLISAGKTQVLRMRVTASMQSPEPIESRRWRGRPGAEDAPVRVFDLGRLFGFRRIDPASLLLPRVEAGELVPNELDQSAALSRWLVDRQRRAVAGGEPAGGRAVLELAGAWLGLRVGDRLIDAGGRGFNSAGAAQGVLRRGALVTALTLRLPATPGADPTTRIELAL